MLLEQTQAKNHDDFTDAIRLFYDNTSVAKYNFQKLYSLHTLVARLNAIHSDSAASSANPDDPGYLPCNSGLCDADHQHLAGSWSL